MHDKFDIEKEIINSIDFFANYATFLTKAQDSANELKQETMLRILTNSDKYKDQGCFKAWAKSVMKNIFLNEAARHTSHRQTFVEGINYTDDESLHPMATESESQYTKQDIYSAIDKLQRTQAQIIKMRLLGYKYEEIAKAMNISVGYVKSALFEAKIKLKEILED